MSKTVNKYRLRCTTDATDEYVWNTTTPTVCPTNTAHTINPNLTVIVDTVSSSMVEIREEQSNTTNTPTQGYYKSKGFCCAVAPNTNAVLDIQFPYPITIMNGWFHSTEKQIGDKVDAVAAPNTIIGGITAPVNTGNTTINVSSTVPLYLSVGNKVNLLNVATLASSQLGDVVSIDSGNGKIVVENAADQNWTNPAYTVVRMNKYLIEDLHITNSNMRYGFAEKKIGGSYLPKNTKLEVKYTNNEGNAKNFVFNVEYLY